MRRVLPAGLLLSLAGIACAQEPPVTKREFSIIAGEIEGALNRGLKMELPVRKPLADKSPMPRTEIIAELDKLFVSVKPRFTSTPRPYRYDKALIEKFNKGDDVQTLMKLCRWGTVSPAGPLVTASDKGLTPLELGDTLGSFILQISALTHHPSPLWSPNMMKPGG